MSFHDYVEYGEITPAFLNDLDNLIGKLHRRYVFAVSFDDYKDACIDKIVRSMPNYDPSYKIGTYIYSLLRNEASRLNSKHKRDSPVEFDENQSSDRDPCSFHDYDKSIRMDRDLRIDIQQFHQRARNLGVEIDTVKLYSNLQHVYHDKELSPLTKVFLWFRSREHLK